MRFAIVLSEFHRAICDGLLKGARTYLEEEGCPVSSKDIFLSPGAFEIPLLAKKLAKTKRYDGIISLACLIKGETAHFEYISSSVSWGIQKLSLEMEIPISFGVLTTYNWKDAEKRSLFSENNKGREAAKACWQMATTLANLQDTVD